MSIRLFPFVLAAIVFLSSCAEQRLVANGARHEHPIHLGDEYTWKELNPIEVEGKAVFGIPSAAGQAGNNGSGLIINLDGPGGFKFPKIVPLLTMIAGTMVTAYTMRDAGGQEFNNQSREVEYKLPLGLALPLAIPVWGAVQNFAYSGMSNSGVSSELQRQLIVDNPDVDLFFNPRYDIEYKQDLFSQESKIRIQVKGATMRPSNR